MTVAGAAGGGSWDGQASLRAGATASLPHDAAAHNVSAARVTSQRGRGTSLADGRSLSRSRVTFGRGQKLVRVVQRGQFPLRRL